LTLYNGKPAGLISIIEITQMKIVEFNLQHKNLKLEEAEKQLQFSNDQLNRVNVQLQEQNAILKVAKDRAEESDRLKSAFLANMSHEIRTPMNAIMGFAEILADADVLLEEQKEYGQTIYSRAQHLLQIINDIVDISKIEANLLSIHKSTFDINTLLNDIRKLFVSVLKGKDKTQVEIEVQNPDGKQPLLIHTDKHRLEQVLSNLIDNAIKFTDSGCISFGYDLQANGTMEFFVADTGSGIPPSETEKIFDRFVMAQNAVNDKHEGTGLGLAISKSLTKLLGGGIWIESSTDKGTVFRFRIQIDNLKEDQKVIDENTESNHDVLFNKNILIVEDDKWSANYMETILLDKKVNTYVCNTGEQGIAFLQSGEPCDLVLLDIKLPGISGLETVAKMKSLKPQIPIIAQTAYALNEDRDKTLAAGCDDYMAKPINSNKLIELIVKYLDRR
jgi:signal transduction histidine kinase/CheY-like chemotaxis protein